MKLILDERETELYDRCYAMIYNEEPKLQNTIQLSKKVLELGDAMITTDDDKLLLLIERKCFSDLLASIKDGRYEEQSYRIVHTCGIHLHNVIYVLEGVFSQLRSVQDKKIVYSALTSLNYFKGFSVMKTSSVRETAELILYMADKIMREKTKVAAYTQQIQVPLVSDIDNIETPAATDVATATVSSVDYCNVVKKAKKENITRENIGQILLSQIPGISATTAIHIMKGYRSFDHFMQTIRENPSVLESIRIETDGKSRKLGKNCIDGIKTYLIDTDTNINTNSTETIVNDIQ